MSASQDKTQRFTFVGSNLYQIHSRGVDPSQAPGLRTGEVLKPAPGRTSIIIKPADIVEKNIKVEEHQATNLRSVFNRDLNLAPVRQHDTVAGLKKNLNELEGLHSRLKFMLHELKDLVNE